MPQAGDVILAQDRAAVDSDEGFGVELFFQSGDRLQQQVGLVADVKPDVIALRIDPAHVRDRHPDQFRAVRDPQFAQPSAIARFGGFAPLCQSAADRPFQPFGCDRLQDIVDRIQIERLDREALVRGDEDDRGRGGRLGEPPGYLDPVEPGHRQVQQNEVGRLLSDNRQRGLAMVGRADDFDPLYPAAKRFQSLDRERLVVDQDNAQGCVIVHSSYPAA